MVLYRASTNAAKSPPEHLWTSSSLSCEITRYIGPRSSCGETLCSLFIAFNRSAARIHSHQHTYTSIQLEWHLYMKIGLLILLLLAFRLQLRPHRRRRLSGCYPSERRLKSRHTAAKFPIRESGATRSSPIQQACGHITYLPYASVRLEFEWNLQYGCRDWAWVSLLFLFASHLQLPPPSSSI
jgi:hypothetical protein